MIRDILFVLMVLSVTVYAHAKKSEIIDLIDFTKMQKRIVISDESMDK